MMNVKVLWPDGPRWVGIDKIKQAACDALADEAGLHGISPDRLSPTEAVHLVNHYGCYTTEPVMDAISRELEEARGSFADACNEVLDGELMDVIRKAEPDSADHVQSAQKRWSDASQAVHDAVREDARVRGGVDPVQLVLTRLTAPVEQEG